MTGASAASRGHCWQAMHPALTSSTADERAWGACLHIPHGIKAVHLVEQLQHGALDLALAPAL